MRFVDLAQVSAAVSGTGARNEKTALLAEVLGRLDPGEVAAAVGFLTGTPRQGSIGIGWATLARVEVAPSPEPQLEVVEIDRALDQLAATTGPGSTTERGRILADLLGRATGIEQDYLRRVLTGGIRQGALTGVVTAAAAKAAGVPLALFRRALMLCGDLGWAATVALTDGADGLRAVDIEVGRPILPMLASTAADVAVALDGLGPVQVDWKLDGARIQVHRDGDRVTIHTRNLNEVTDRLPHVVALVRALPCRQVVLDGEVIGLHGDDLDGAAGDPRAFQETMSAFGTTADGGPVGGGPAAAAGLRPFFFDLMYLDGESLIDRPLTERTAALDRLAPEDTIPRIITDDVAEAAAHLDQALERGHEGVMVKAVDSTYEAGRRGRTWRKVKPVHTLDLVVLAAEWGHGRRRGWLSNLHLGARHPDTGELVMVGKTFKGLTDDLLAWQTERFQELATHESEGGHTVHLRPELVVEIALDGAQTSTRYPGGVALRFARVRGYRPDRTPADADTLDAVRALL